MPPSGSGSVPLRRSIRKPHRTKIPSHSSFDQEIHHLFRSHWHRTVDLHRGLLKATRARDNGRILQYLSKGARDPTFIRAIPATTFTEILRLFGPDRELRPVVDSLEHTWWFPDSLRHLRTKKVQEHYDHALQGLLNMRLQGCAPLSPVDLGLVLRGAGEAHGVHLATEAIKELKAADLEPDVDGFNALMRATLYNRRGGGGIMIGFGVNPLWFRTRQKGLTDWALPEMQYVEKVKDIYRNMLESGGIANQETIICLIMCFAREAKLDDVNQLLANVWDVNVDAVFQGDQVPPPKPLPAGSPLRPTEELLLAIVEAYGTNSQSMTALALVDHLSASYGIPISNRVWSALLIQVYVESNLIQGNNLNKWLHDHPQLPREAPVRLFDTLRNEPYNVKPTMVMYYFVIKRATQAFRWIHAVDLVRDAARIYDESALDASDAAHDVRVAKRRLAEGGVSSAPLFELAQRRETKLLEFRRNRVMMESLCHMLIKGGIVPGAFHMLNEADEAACTDELGFSQEHPKGDYVVQPHWSFIGLPNFIKEFVHLLPPAVSYRTQTGYVRLQVHEFSRFEERQAKIGEVPSITAMNADMTRRIADRKGFREELAAYEKALADGREYDYKRLLDRSTHFEDPPDCSIQVATRYTTPLPHSS
ncbi:mitochondrial ATPase expression-domain-containing protein [Phyllosticta citrichinensis]|uniref:Mitochondrial ATPase expression-domain-containing protein n=1 Tax=Phyllosticta citrichinensis TaxID=1130410 RepID=A0ABR1Y6Z6_9PEZI